MCKFKILKSVFGMILFIATKTLNIYVGPQSDTVPVPELGHLTVPVLELGEFVPVPELGSKIRPSSGTGSCEAPRYGTGCPVPELDNDLCTTSTPISALVPILALVPEWGLCLCPRSGTQSCRVMGSQVLPNIGIHWHILQPLHHTFPSFVQLY